MNMKILPSAYSRNPMHFLLGGDAEVLIWERLWNRYKSNPEVLEYDLLLTPHHCSWHSLSYYSWSQWGEDALVCDAARNALGQARSGATIVSSSKQILDDDYDLRVFELNVSTMIFWIMLMVGSVARATLKIKLFLSLKWHEMEN
ncbi:hypothetical protein [Klebsiella michiganensis]|nr:hypothetical protein [Klebsiella michiganensis]